MSKPNTAPALVTMSFEAWAKEFKPFVNHLNPTAPVDGYMLETYGSELMHVLLYANGYMGRAGNRKVWTIVDGDDGEMVLVEGYHLCNRIGYITTAKPAKVGVQYNISL